MRPLKIRSHRVDNLRYGDLPYQEVWRFRTRRDPDFRPLNKQKARQIAENILQFNARILKLRCKIDNLHLRYQKTTRSLGGWHVLFRQYIGDLPVYRAYVSVHLDNEGRVYLAYGRTVPEPEMLPKGAFSAKQKKGARDRALKAIAYEETTNPDTPLPNADKKPRATKLWFPTGNKVWPAYRLWFKRFKLGDKHVAYMVYINIRTGDCLQIDKMLKQVNGRGLVFDPSPVAALADHKLLLSRKGGRRTLLSRKAMMKRLKTALRPVILKGLRRTGFLDGIHVTTDGTKERVKRRKRKFYFKPTERGFEEVMAYYHIDSAVRYVEDLGFRGSRAIFRKPLSVDAWSSSQGNDSEYDPYEMRLKFGYLGIDLAEDGETILHEFGHALQDAICPRFGQSEQALAIGEGFSDYLAASFFAHNKPCEYQASVMTWKKIVPDQNDLPPYPDPPCERRVDDKRLFAGYKLVEEHEDGKLWSGTLWDIWQALGREKADTLIIESHFQLDGYTTFARAARAILDADKNLYRGVYRRKLVRIFRRHGLRW